MGAFRGNRENQSTVRRTDTQSDKFHWEIVFLSFFSMAFINIKSFYHLFLLPMLKVKCEQHVVHARRCAEIRWEMFLATPSRKHDLSWMLGITNFDVINKVSGAATEDNIVRLRCITPGLSRLIMCAGYVDRIYKIILCEGRLHSAAVWICWSWVRPREELWYYWKSYAYA